MILIKGGNAKKKNVMENLWKTYQKNYSYAADISWHTIMKSICTLYGSMLK